MNPIGRFGLAGLTLALLGLSACTVLEGDKINYKSAGTAPSLEVPPDLTQLPGDSRYTLPGNSGSVTASGYQAGQQSATARAVPTAARSVGDVRIEREGNQRWLVVDRPADKLWEPVRDFWLENGFLLAVDDRKLGIMETDWAENRAKIPQDFIRRTIGKVFDSAYSSSERDKFRTRLERAGDGKTDIFISQRGMEEVYADNKERARTVWQPRAPDPELEAEFLRRLMVKLGVAEEKAKTLVASSEVTPPAARIENVGGAPMVRLADDFDRAWRRVGLALDRTGFTVEDRDRGKGLYFVRYVDPTESKEPGFFSKVFGSGAAAPPLKYRIAVQSQGQDTMVSVQNPNGEPASSANAQRIVKVIADDLK